MTALDRRRLWHDCGAASFPRSWRSARRVVTRARAFAVRAKHEMSRGGSCARGYTKARRQPCAPAHDHALAPNALFRQRRPRGCSAAWRRRRVDSGTCIWLDRGTRVGRGSTPSEVPPAGASDANGRAMSKNRNCGERCEFGGVFRRVVSNCDLGWLAIRGENDIHP